MKNWLIAIIILGSILIALILQITIICLLWKPFRPGKIPQYQTEYIDNFFRLFFLQPPKKTINRVKVKPGMVCLDIGPGKDSYTFELARQAYYGKTYAVDISESVIKRLDKRLKKKS
ncbi:MAG: hypothetical protein U9O98_02930 [Asgard group archaeon]|nr:hypothetical protein [Asgard group archaeon]